jgi:hypothetical protein
VASSIDTKPLQTNNLAVTPQPMTATLIFRRQLVRPRPHLLTASSTADKLPLEKFHRLLNLVFWVKFLKSHSILSFVFLWVVYRVSPGITGYHRVSPGITRPGWSEQGLRRSYNAAGGGGPQLAVPPGPRLTIAKFWYCIHCLQLSYSVLHWLNNLEPELPVLGLIQLTEGFKSHVIDTD